MAKDRKRLTILYLLFSIFYILSSVCFAGQSLSSTELIENARELDGQEVAYQGEVIGEVMLRQDYAWININDGKNAIGIWASDNFLNLISFAGSYKAKGDWLEVVGKFNRACPMHGGDLDIHALKVIKLREGRIVKHRLVPEKQRLVIILSGAFLCLLIGQLLKKRLSRK